MFAFMILAGLCVLSFPLMGIKDIKKEKRSHQVTRVVFILIGLFFLWGGVVTMMSY